ncbi:ATP-binding cassette domain-containing protein [Desulfopila sp. IMCC35006]|uniref:ABC transporter ATP-binding protein n=1 Tax=Desulfopila sp. IMCC35006 TaxID=2569542 RepID=UPI0010ACF264|nr:ABC transporter ATP-binding protein [Desulfopila sp. IMCC35006]TKB26999.1 ATP-binding cassette domain-containing protein [Desulfopila sp. IMCC35006]
MISYESVTKIYGKGNNTVTALDNVSFTIPKGEVVVFLGPSGCGKTTTLRLTNRLETLTRGVITIEDQNIMDIDVVQLRQRLGYVIQAIGLFPNKTIAENIAVVPRLLHWDEERISKRIDELLQMTNLDPDLYRDRYPAELSGGQQQRVGVARGLAADPNILLMDEPFGAIDPINREEIQDEFLKLQAKLKKTVAFVSHDIHEAIKMGDRIAIFDKGRLVQYDTPEIILTQPKNKFVSDFVGADRALKVLGLMRVSDIINRKPKNIIQGADRCQEALHFLNTKESRYGIVIEDNRPIGFVTQKSLKYEDGPVRDVVEPYPIFLREKTPLRDVLSSMLMYSTPTFCVVDGDKNFAGTVTYNDIQKAVKASYADETENVEIEVSS